jgi:beta-barrel assembly-enhancing protease
MNLFTPAQDIEMGRQVSADAEKQLQMMNDRRIDDYLNRLGKKLAEKAPGEKFPYQFKGVNDPAINAFALPGGFLYVNRGTIEAAETEAQLAGVIAHEISHAALRHGTNQASKAYLAQAPLAVLGGLGGRSITSVLAQIGGGFAANSVLLKYSRDAERQADLMGAQILYDSGYDPRAMMQFFEKMQAQGGSKMPQWLSTHPNTENRISDISSEIDRLGGPSTGALSDSPEFRSIRSYTRTLPRPKENPKESPAPKQPAPGTAGPKPAGPSERLRDYSNDLIRLRHPENWTVSGDQEIVIAPERGVIRSNQGNSIAYGVMIAVFTPKAGKTGRFDLREATDQLTAQLQKDNPNMVIAHAATQTRVDGERALSANLRNDSATGGKESVWLVTILRPEGLVYFICVAPEGEYASYRDTFENLINSVQFVR